MPNRVAVFYHPDCVLHETGPHHPERPERGVRVEQALRQASFGEFLDWYEPEPVEAEWIESIHSAEYRQFIEESCLKGKESVDFGETHVGMDSYRAALLAAGGAVGAVESVVHGGYRFAFSACRPPGHHARAEQAMGFCLFNNIAIAADYAEKALGLERLAILDWDVHHGNGTQDAFYNSPSVHFCSTHQAPLYPHTGHIYEDGTGSGRGMNLNCPLEGGSGLEDILRELKAEWIPALERVRPELILVSAGFDAHRLDPLAGMSLESADFGELTQFVCEQASRFCEGRVVSVLEGGYHLEALGESAAAHIEACVQIP